MEQVKSSTENFIHFLDAFVEQKKSEASQLLRDNKNFIQETVAQVDKFQQNINYARKMNREVENEVNQERLTLNQLENALSQLKMQEGQLFEQITELQKENIKYKERLEEKIRSNSNLDKQHSSKIAQIQRSLQCYTHLGLEFQNKQNLLQFILTKVDPNDSQRKFYFELFLNDQDQYELKKSQPAIDKKKATELVNNLNSNNNLSQFVVQIRKEYKLKCNN